MIYDEFSPSRTRRTLTAGGRTLRALGLDGPLTGVLAIIVVIGILWCTAHRVRIGKWCSIIW